MYMCKYDLTHSLAVQNPLFSNFGRNERSMYIISICWNWMLITSGLFCASAFRCDGKLLVSSIQSDQSGFVAPWHHLVFVSFREEDSHSNL